jgi:xanthine dehydrogenase iron-sulfur cluster and FAD-binding subunit A
VDFRNFAYLFSENARGKRLTRSENHLVTLTSRRYPARNREQPTPAFGRVAQAHAAWHWPKHRAEGYSPVMPSRQPAKTKPRAANFRARYDALEQRRDELIARLATLGEKAGAHPAHGRARTLLGATFRKASLVQRAAILEAANWLITLLDRATTML